MATLLYPAQLSLGLREAADHQREGILEVLASVIDLHPSAYRAIFAELLARKDLKRLLQQITVDRVLREWGLAFTGTEEPKFETRKLLLTPCVRGISDHGIEVGIPLYIPRAEAQQVTKILRAIIGGNYPGISCVHEEIRLVVDINCIPGGGDKAAR
jgi:hypothetical protein